MPMKEPHPAVDSKVSQIVAVMMNHSFVRNSILLEWKTQSFDFDLAPAGMEANNFEWDQPVVEVVQSSE